MSDFDESTERKLSGLGQSGVFEKYPGKFELALACFNAGRNSAKESLEILARALEHYAAPSLNYDSERSMAGRAIAAVKARGDWPLDKPAEAEEKV